MLVKATVLGVVGKASNHHGHCYQVRLRLGGWDEIPGIVDETQFPVALMISMIVGSKVQVVRQGGEFWVLPFANQDAAVTGEVLSRCLSFANANQQACLESLGTSSGVHQITQHPMAETFERLLKQPNDEEDEQDEDLF
jgi:hypothetical protein